MAMLDDVDLGSLATVSADRLRLFAEELLPADDPSRNHQQNQDQQADLPAEFFLPYVRHGSSSRDDFC